MTTIPTLDSAAACRARAWIEVDLQAIESNARALTTWLAPDLALMAVVKADAYGHGLVPAAWAALRGGARWLGIAAVDEGASLRAAGITAPVGLLCAPPPEDVERVAALGLTMAVGSAALADAIAAAQQPCAVHLDIDTGMGRSGVLPEDAVALWRRCIAAGLTVNGACTHFADADGTDPSLTDLQWERFAKSLEALTAAGAQFDWIHAGNSAAALRCSANGCSLVRPGLLLYGLRPAIPSPPPPASRVPALSPDSLPSFGGRGVEFVKSSSPLEGEEAGHPLAGGGGTHETDGDTACLGAALTIRPALALKARISAVRKLPAGSTISYGATCRLTRQSRAATVLIGYGDGYPRRLSNCGFVLVRGRRAPILGRVCMDQLVADVTDIPAAAAGDIATCIGRDGDELIPAEEIAALIDTTEHEVTTCLTSRLPRIYR